MAREHHGGIGKLEEFFPDSPEEQLPVAARQIPSSHAASEKHVAADEHSVLRIVKAEAPRTVARHVKNPERLATEALGVAFVEEQVCLERLDFESEPEPPEKRRIRRHRGGIRVVGDAASVAALDLRSVRRVVVVAVREDEEVDLVSGEPRIRPLWGVEEDRAIGSVEQEGIRVEGAAGEEIEPIHGFVVRK